MIILDKHYTAESLLDVEEDMEYAIEIADIPKDEHNFMRGEFRVTIEWIDE